MLEPLHEPLLPQPCQLQLGLSDLISLPIGKWHYTYTPSKFHGQIVSIELTQKVKIAQWLRSIHTGTAIIKFGYYPEYARDGTLRVLTRKWKKIIHRYGAKDPMQRRTITGLSKRMCKAFRKPTYRNTANNSRSWQRKYEKHIAPHFRFLKPQWESYFEALVTIQPPPDLDNVLVDVVIAYDPYVNMRSDVSWSIDTGSWKKVGLVGRAREDELKKIEKKIVHFGAAKDMFSDDQ